MATSAAEKDDRDEDEKDDAGEGGDDEGGDEQEAAEEKPAEKKTAEKKSADKKPAAAKSAGKAAPGAKRAGKPGAAKPATPAQRGSFGKSLILFVIVFGGLAGAFAYLGNEANAPLPRPKWLVGSTVDIEVWLQKSDKFNLACVAPDEIGGKHCAFEDKTKPWSKGDNNDDQKLLKPYTLTDNSNHVAAAGLWSQPALAADKIPDKMNRVSCKFKVEGMIKKISFRWNPTAAWGDDADWYAGSVSDCKIVP
jgi:hypothetical protein